MANPDTPGTITTVDNNGGKIINLEVHRLRRENQQLQARIRNLEDALEQIASECLRFVLKTS